MAEQSSNDAVGGGRQGAAWAPCRKFNYSWIDAQYSRTKQADFNPKQFVKGESTLGKEDLFNGEI